MRAPLVTPKEQITCEICGDSLSCRWTDTHGIGACLTCGAPYRLYHYAPDKKRVDKSPAIQIRPEWIPILKRYWEEVGHNCDPGGFNFSGSSYEVASEEDFRLYIQWMEKHKDELPKEEES